LAISAFPTLTFVDEQHGWFAFGDTVLSTQDGGRYWASQSTLPSIVDRLSFASIDVGWAATRDGLLATRDAGKTWRPMATGTSGRPAWVQFVDDLHGWIFTLSDQPEGGIFPQALLFTADAGKTWRNVTDPCRPRPDSGREFSFVSPQSGFAICVGPPGAGQQSKSLFQTADSGDTWRMVQETNITTPGAAPNGLPGGGYATDLYIP
jgi:photosystem II stability/assembly factor-like uncharacterized protein